MEQNETLLTVAEISKRLNVSVSWVSRKVSAKIMPHFRIGRTIRFSWKEIQDWLGKQHIQGCSKV